MAQLQKLQIIGAVVAALTFLILNARSPNATNTTVGSSLEAVGFLLSATAVYSSGRALRERYEALGSDRNTARNSSNYMQMRATVRLWAYLAALTMAAVGAHRVNIAPWTAIASLAIGLPPMMWIVDQVAGWRER